jgi:hypothetical protein
VPSAEPLARYGGDGLVSHNQAHPQTSHSTPLLGRPASFCDIKLVLRKGEACTIGYIQATPLLHFTNIRRIPMEYAVELIEPDADGVEYYVTRYKAFRLAALQADPSCE